MAVNCITLSWQAAKQDKLGHLLSNTYRLTRRIEHRDLTCIYVFMLLDLVELGNIALIRSQCMPLKVSR